MEKFTVGTKGLYSHDEGENPVQDVPAEIVKVNNDDTYDVRLSLPDGSQRVEQKVLPSQFEKRK